MPCKDGRREMTSETRMWMLLLEASRIIMGKRKGSWLSKATHVGMERRDSKTGQF